MILRRSARRWAAAGLLAALGGSIEGTALAQQGMSLPAIGSGSNIKLVSAPPRVDSSVQGVSSQGTGSINSLPMPGVPMDTAVSARVLDDGLGAQATPPATPIPVAPAAPPMVNPGEANVIPFALPPALAPAPGSCSAQPAAPATSAAPCSSCCGAGFDWAKVPPVRVLPRPGYFIIPPTDPGYYTAYDQLVGNFREKPPAYPYPRFGFMAFPFFDYSFAYLDKPDNTDHNPLDPLKRIHLGDDWLLSLGGEFRYRHQNETDYLGNKAGTNNSPDFYRTRLFADLWYKNLFRVYVEGIDARADYFNPPLVPGPLDQNHFDFLNAFIDVKIPFLDEGTTRNSYVRVGRQELCYGSQRLVSTVDYSNTRGINFQGVNVFSHGEKFDFDSFLVNPLIHSTAIDKIDSIDDKQVFAGAWATYRPAKGQSTELYWLNLSNANPTFTGSKGAKGGFDINTIGTRYNGIYNNFLWDFEGMLQFGTYVNQTDAAGATVAQVGYQFKDLPMNPQFWLGYDWASGSSDTGAHHGTFNQLFAFGHYYMGQADVVGRQNINDVYGQFVFFPSNWITAISQYHAFYLDNARDSLYNKIGVASRSDPTGKSGTDVGQELDFLLNFHLTTYQDFQFGYSHFFSGTYMAKTGSGKDIDFTYVQYTFRF